MSTFSTSLINAEAVQGMLEDHYRAFSPANQFTNIAVQQFLVSDLNTNNVLQQTVAPGRGKKRIVTTLYQARIAEDDIGTSISRDCTSENEAGHLDAQCEIDLAVGVEVDESIDFKNLADIGEDNNSYFIRRIAAMFDGARRKMETSIVGSLVAGTGGFASGDNDVTSDIKSIRTIKSGTAEDLSMLGAQEIWYTKELIGYDRFYTFGSSEITKYARALGDGCCVDAGVDLEEYFGNSGWVHTHTHRVPSAFSANEDFLALVPGAAHLVYMNLYEGINVEDGGKVRSTITDPLTGIPFDYAFDLGCDTATMQLSLPFTVCTAPDGYFNVGDRLNGVNGLFQFRVDNS